MAFIKLRGEEPLQVIDTYREVMTAIRAAHRPGGGHGQNPRLIELRERYIVRGYDKSRRVAINPTMIVKVTE